jgi:CubicO group peptidase (beta-lactamase class C family)
MVASLAAACLVGVGGLAARQDSGRDADFTSLRSMIDSQIAGGVPSIAVAIARHGQTVWEYAAGFGDTATKRAATSRTPFYLASISKTMTMTAVMHLVARHELALDRPVNDYLGAARVRSVAWDLEKATIRRVASHTAGFATYDRECLIGDRACNPSPVEAIRRYAAIAWPPGEQFDYSNLGYGVLGEVVARASHEIFERALAHLVFEPLQMTTCRVGLATGGSEPQATRYDISSPPRQPSPPRLSTTPGASAVYCSVDDLLRFGMFHLKDHLASQRPILPDTSIEEMQVPTPEPRAAQQYGLGWWTQADLHGFRGVLAQGGTSNATARLQLIPSEDVAVAVVANSAIDSPALVDEALAIVLPEYRRDLQRSMAAGPSTSAPVPTPASPAAAALPTDMAGRWVGFIETYKGRVPFTVVIDTSRSLVATIGTEQARTIASARFGPSVVRWTMSAHLGVDGEPFDLAMRLYRRGSMLAGAAQAQPAAGNPAGFLTYFPVRLTLK